MKFKAFMLAPVVVASITYAYSKFDVNNVQSNSAAIHDANGGLNGGAPQTPTPTQSLPVTQRATQNPDNMGSFNSSTYYEINGGLNGGAPQTPTPTQSLPVTARATKKF